MSHTITDLRVHLFETIKALRDKDNPMPIDRGKAIADVAQTLINSAKVEVDMINAVGAKQLPPTGFIASSVQKPVLEHEGTVPARGGGLPPRGPAGRI